MQSSRGFTIIELMITIVVLAVLISIAAPSFQRVIEDNRVTTQVNEFIAAVNTARSEAIRVGGAVSLIARGGGTFLSGWCIQGGTGAACVAGSEIFVHAAMQNVVVTGGTNRFVFERLGEMTVPAAMVTLTVRPQSCPPGDWRMRRITVIPSGRPSVERIQCPP